MWNPAEQFVGPGSGFSKQPFRFGARVVEIAPGQRGRDGGAGAGADGVGGDGGLIDVALRSVTDQQVHYAAARTELTALAPDGTRVVPPTSTPDESGVLVIPASEVNPADKAALALEDQEGAPC